MKIYEKRGNLNYKERKIIEQIKDAIDRKMVGNPDFKVNTAKSMKELEGLYREHCVETVEFTEVPNGSKEKVNIEPEVQNQEQTMSEETTSSVEGSTEQTKKPFDPFNREKPLVREYVRGSDFPGEKMNEEGTNKSFGEPQTAFDQMQMPPDTSDMGAEEKKETHENFIKGGASKPEPKASKGVPMSSDSNGPPLDLERKKNAKKMAKTVVLLVVGLYQKGLVWWGTKDTNEASLIAMEVAGEIDCSALLQLSDDQQITVRDFFASQEQQIKQCVIIEKEEIERLTESLTAVMIKKELAPSHEQVLLFEAVEILGLKLLAVWGIQKQNKGILEQLIIANKRVAGGHEEYVPPVEQKEEKQEEPVEQNSTELVTQR